jgi:hypothetical protein
MISPWLVLQRPGLHPHPAAIPGNGATSPNSLMQAKSMLKGRLVLQCG